MKPFSTNGLEDVACRHPESLVLSDPDRPYTEGGGNGFLGVWGCQTSRPFPKHSLRGRLIIRNGVGGRLGLIAEIRRFCEAVFVDSRVKMVYVTNDETRAFVTTANTAEARVQGCRLECEEREQHHVFDIERTSLPIFVATGR